MSCHDTRSGHVQLIGAWGKYKSGTQYSPNTPATLIIEDSGQFTQWKFTGKRDDALVTLGHMYVNGSNADRVAYETASGLTIERAPSDFWIESDDGEEFLPNLAEYPDVIAW